MIHFVSFPNVGGSPLGFTGHHPMIVSEGRTNLRTILAFNAQSYEMNIKDMGLALEASSSIIQRVRKQSMPSNTKKIIDFQKLF
jgi:hypothetical protein